MPLIALTIVETIWRASLISVYHTALQTAATTMLAAPSPQLTCQIVLLIVEITTLVVVLQASSRRSVLMDAAITIQQVVYKLSVQ